MAGPKTHLSAFRFAFLSNDLFSISPKKNKFNFSFYYQIFGFDLLLVEPDCRPVLLEVNSSPSLRIDCMRPLVRYASVAARQGLSPEIVVNSPKYSAFFRSRIDEMVKLGLLKATLLLMGSRIIHQRLLRYSPEKAQAFLEACGYQIPQSMRIDTTNEVIAKKAPNPEE